MRRIFATVGFSSFFITIFAVRLGQTFALALSITALIAFVLCLVIKKWQVPVVLLLLATISLFSFNTFLFNRNVENDNLVYCKENKEISGTLLDYPEASEAGFDYVFKANDGNNIKFSLFCYDKLDIEPGDAISGRFDFSNQYAELDRNIYFSAYVYNIESVKITHKNDTFNIAKIRASIKSGITKNMTYGAGVAKAIVFGDKSGIDDDLHTAFQRSGILHTTATSGLHLSIVTGFLFAFLSLLGVSRKKSSITAIVFVVLFMVIIGFKFSLMRAGIMMIVVLASNLFNRENDVFNAIGLALTVLILLNPYSALSVSLLLSVCATMGIVLSFEHLFKKAENRSANNAISKVFYALAISIIQSVAAVVFTLPIVYIFFGYVSLAGVFVNAILSPFITLVLILGVLICALQFLPVVPYVLGGANDVFALVIIRVARFVSGFKYSQISIDYDFIAISFAVCLIVVAIAIFIHYYFKADKERLLKITSLICVNVFLVSILIYLVLPNNNVKICVQNSGGAVNVLIYDGEKAVVVDYGGKYCDRKTKYILNRNNAQKIDCLILPNADENGFSSGVMISSEIETKNTLINTRVFEKDLSSINSKKQNIENVKEINYNNISIDLITVSRITALYISNGEQSVLMLDKLFNLEKLPTKYLECDAVIFNQGVSSGIEKIKAKKAIVFSYEEQEENECAKHFTSYSLRKGSKALYLNDSLKIKKV